MRQTGGWMACAALTMAITMGPARADSNVALYSMVELAGADFGYNGDTGGGPLADALTVTDGLFLDEGHQWNLDTVFWHGQSGADLLNIFLPSVAHVTRLVLQADNNDTYLIRYRDTSFGWHDLVTMYGTGVWGMNTLHQTLDTPVNATAFAIVGNGGDRAYAVSEFQAIGSFGAQQPEQPLPVPEPSALAMLGAGLAALGLRFIGRRKTLS